MGAENETLVVNKKLRRKKLKLHQYLKRWLG